VPNFETKDYFLKNYILGLSTILLSLREKGLLIQALPLDFPVHLTSLVIMCWSGPGKKISLSQLGKTFPGTAGHGHSCLNHKEWMNLSHEGKEGAPTRSEGAMDHEHTSRLHQNDHKKIKMKRFFLFHLGNVFIISVTQSTFPLTVEFDVCQIFPCWDLTSQLQLQG
jgi:hypothetical protein